MFQSILSRLQGRSAADVARLVALNTRHALRAVSRAARAARSADRAFDRRWGTDTSRAVSVRNLDLGDARLPHCNRYEASSEAMLRDPITALALDPTAHDFIDYGAGKGRVMMLAMHMGFRSVTGIELSTRLCDIARANLTHFAAQIEVVLDARVISADATAYMPTGRNLVAYFYNPFDASIMEVVRQRLEDALAAATERVIVIYANPEHAAVFDDAAGWIEAAAAPGWKAYVAHKAAIRPVVLSS